MKKNSLNVLIITSKDEFLNEYVDKSISPRIYLTGFDGTAGDLLITQEEAFLLVDGRYHTQAETQIDKNLFHVEKVGVDESGTRINELVPDRLIKIIARLSKGKNLIIGYDPGQFSIKMLDYLREETNKVSNTTVFTPLYVPLKNSLLGDAAVSAMKPVSYIPLEITGNTSSDKLKQVRENLLELNLNAFFISKTDEVSYITNLRGQDIDFNSTIKAYAFISLKDAFLFMDLKYLGCQNLQKLNEAFEVLPLSELEKTLHSYIERQQGRFHFGYDPSSMTCAILDKLNRLVTKNCKMLNIEDNPVKKLKAIKNDAELSYMKTCFVKADNVFNNVISQINTSIQQQKTVSEWDIKNMVSETFKNYGANRLSFESICSIGSNSAVIHYTSCSKDVVAKEGDIILIDSGGYFEGGYATDLTRTFIAGGGSVKPSDKIKEIFTIVLKAAMKGLRAEIPPDSDGIYLDKIVRSVITDKGYDYNHGTGHGIGILVHETPPTISFAASGSVKLEENMVFSIEPGIYIEGWGGVRIENVVTLKRHNDKNKAHHGWLEVECLTFAPIDENLINYSLLDEDEIAYLSYFKNNFMKLKPLK